MSDDMWRRREGRREPSEASEFGGPLFPDDPAEEPADETGGGDDTGARRLRFGPDDTGPLPHWTAPPTGEVPRIAPPSGTTDDADEDDDDEVDVWSTFTTESPVWRDDDPVTGVMEQVPNDFGAGREPSGGFTRAATGPTPGTDPTGDVDADHYGAEPSGEISTGMGRPYGRTRDASGSVPTQRPEPGRITIGTDPSGAPRRQPDPGRRRPGPNQRAGRPAGPARTGAAAPPRNMTTAVIVGAALAAAFVAALFISPLVVLGVIMAVLAIAGYEYFGKVTEKGYRPAVVPGLVACAGAPLAAYNFGERALPLILVLAFVVGAVGFIGSAGVESGPLPNMAVTTMGVVWIAVLGSFAALILRLSTGLFEVKGFLLPGGGDVGTDTLFMVVLGVAVNDIGALVVGSAVGRTPLRSWISPSKTVEGLLGGTLATFVALFIASKLNDGGTWTELTDVLLLALAIAVFAPLGDLTESMFKRNLDVKDFGTLVQGHGGVLDRFDGFLFALPAAYYLTLVLIANDLSTATGG